MTISEFLTANGWKREYCAYGGYTSGYVDSSNDRLVDLSGDSGYQWELQYFDDSDVDGVATGRWIESGAAGDTLAELRHVLKLAPRDVYAYVAAVAAGDDMRGGY